MVDRAWAIRRVACYLFPPGSHIVSGWYWLVWPICAARQPSGIENFGSLCPAYHSNNFHKCTLQKLVILSVNIIALCSICSSRWSNVECLYGSFAVMFTVSPQELSVVLFLEGDGSLVTVTYLSRFRSILLVVLIAHVNEWQHCSLCFQFFNSTIDFSDQHHETWA